jgi:hypothetical protein
VQGVTALNLKDAIQKLFSDAKDIAQLIAPLCAVLGFIGLGIVRRATA